jgi:hypothetical protein
LPDNPLLKLIEEIMKNKLLSIAFLFAIPFILAACGGKPGTGYEIKGNQVYYSTDGQNGEFGRSDAVVELIPEAEADSFEILGQFDYAKDAKHVFLMGTPLEGADPATFKVISLDPPYARDSQRVYYNGSLITGAQTDSFQILGSSGNYARDSQQVYYQGQPLTGAQSETFKVLSKDDALYRYAADSIHVYFNDQVLEGALPDSFEVLVKPGAVFTYARDQQRVYQGDQVITGADPQTFQVLGDGEYSKDAKQVYDSTASVLSGADVATFELLSDGYAKDAKQVYWSGLSIDGADPATFKVQNGKGRDKNGCYDTFQKADC